MKVILFNGSRNEKGSTYTSLKIVADALVENGIEAEIFWVDGRALSGEMKELVDEAESFWARRYTTPLRPAR